MANFFSSENLARTESPLDNSGVGAAELGSPPGRRSALQKASRKGRVAADLTGQRFGRLVVVARHKAERGVKWECRCDCGRSSVVYGPNLKSGGTKSCGCLGGGPRAQDLTGQRFGRLVVVARRKVGKHAKWECDCDCGRSTFVFGFNLKAGRTKSCGCLEKEYQHASKPKEFIDIAGQRFGGWVALSLSRRQGGRQLWLCRCDCGVEREVWKGNLLRGTSKSCGCRIATADLSGQRFGRLVVVAQCRGEKGVKWECRCDCGRSTIVYGFNLRNGGTRSCGCSKKRRGESAHRIQGDRS